MEEINTKTENSRVIDVIGIDMTDVIENDKYKKENEKYSFLKKALRNELIFWGRVIGYEEEVQKDENGEIKSLNMFVKVEYDGEEILIPDSQYFEPTFRFSRDDSKLSKSKLRYEKKKRIEYQLDAKVCFVLTYLDRIENDDEYKKLTGSDYHYNILASRTKAMEKLRDYYFYHSRKDTEYPPEIKVGDKTLARVLSVRDNMVLVECLGIETRLDEFELSNKVVNNCNDFVKAGDNLSVTVTKFYLESENGKLPYLKVSAREGVLSSNLSNIKVGNVYKGKVSHRNKTKHIYSIVLNNGVMVTVPENRVMGNLDLDRNDNVVVTIKRIDGPFVLGVAYKAR